ncbi:hypothetical protein N9D47_06850 [Planktomarina temperata]|nr:hypothetical protein [Planktomarina temperata]
MKIMVFPSLVALTACGGDGGSSTGGVMYQPKSYVISEKSEFLQLQDGLNVGDTLEYPFSLFNPALEGNVTGQVIAITDNGYVVVNGKLPSRTDVPNGQRSLGASDNFYETLFVSGDKTGWNYTTIVEDAGTFITVSFEEKSGEIFGIASEYQRDENRPDGARVDSFARRITVDGSTVVGMSSSADGSSFNKVNGTFTYTGLGAIAVGTEIFSGGVEMQTTFGNIESSAAISAPTLTNGSDTASFSGNVIIDNVSGIYLTEEAQISTASNSEIAATILGQFNTDSTASSATIYDNSTNGKDVIGSFTVAK